VAVGARGDAGVVSFGYAKPLELAAGGFVLTDDGELAARTRAAVSSGPNRLLAGLKNRIALRLMFKDRYETMVRGDRRWGLLRYAFPRRQLAALERRWDGWLDAAQTVRERLHAAGGLLASLAQVEPFAYAGRDWLPWRYSFKVAAGADVESLRRALDAHGVRTSRLYRPVTEFLDAEVRHPVPAAAALAERTLNLFHRTVPEEAARLHEALEKAVASMETR
jgi:dTDP-4-amino-4,6-dideoxygalactose transaminase